ncbi:MAG: TIGR03032 family protein [Fulvivirga sp.]
MSKPLPPFSCTHSPNIPELLAQLNCTLVISTYQAGKVILISAKDNSNLIQLPRNFQKPMGMALDGNKLAIATKDEVVVLANSPQMAPNYPKQPKTYDALFLPRATYYTGAIDIHDLEWVDGKLWAVNTLFSCIVTLDDNHSFSPVWKPGFVPNYAPADYCHLNGVAMEAGKPKYATALGQTTIPEGWRETKGSGGILIDIAKDEIVARDLPMPHSPRIINGKLYVLLSATGELAQVDLQTGKYHVVKELNGFVRGMSIYEDYIFIGLSKLRENTSAFRDLPIAKKSIFSGVAVLHEPTSSIVGYIKYENSVEEIYDVKVLPDMTRPGLLNHEKPDHKVALVSPVGDFWAVEEKEQPHA